MLTTGQLKAMERAVELGQKAGVEIPFEEIESAMLEHESEVLSDSLYEFIKAAWPIVEPDQKFVDGWHIRAICDHLEALIDGRIKNLLINVPPGTMKSLTSSVFLSPWRWSKRPGTRFLYASYDQALSTRDSLRSRVIIESDWYQTRWGSRFQLRSDQNEKMRFDNDQKGWRLATSAGGKGTGEHPDMIVIDDPHNTRKTESQVDRETIKQWWRSVIVSRGKITDVRRAIIMQRIHEDDLSAYLLDSMEDVTHLCLPMRYEHDRMKTTVLGFFDPRKEEGELLWDPPFTEEKVRSLELEMGSLIAAGQLQQRPSPAGGSMFQREWYEIAENIPPTEGLPAVRYWDLAGTVSKQADYTAGVKMVQMPDKTVLIDDIIHGKWTAGELDSIIKNTAVADGRSVTQWIEQEPGSSGKSVIFHYIKLLAGYPCYGDKVTGSKEVRAMPFAAYSEARMVKIRRGSWVAGLIDELCIFPNGKHDDRVDSVSGAFQKLTGGGMRFTGDLLASGEDPAEERRPFDDEEMEELPDFLRDLVQQSRETKKDRKKWNMHEGIDKDDWLTS